MPREPFDLDRVTTRPIADRRSLVTTDSFATLPEPGAGFSEWLASLPDQLAGRSLRELVAAITAARAADRPVIFGIGGHVVKTGCSPVLIDLMERGIVTGLCMPGSTAIHDWEIARVGRTSEDVAAGLGLGAYGTTEETGAAFAEAAGDGATGKGLGRALGEQILTLDEFIFPEKSLLGVAARLDMPATVHVAIGTDTVHLHPAADGAAIGGATLLDFRILTTVVADLAQGVFVNVGSAVIIPEVFLKAITVARNTGHPVEGLFTANLDMLRHYRPRMNVVTRPPEHGVDLAGHHEVMLPLLRMLLIGAGDRT